MQRKSSEASTQEDMVSKSSLDRNSSAKSSLLNLRSYMAVSLEGDTVQDEEIEILNNNMVCAVVLFQRNIKSFDQVRALVISIRAIKDDMLIFIDNEGVDIGADCRSGVWRALDSNGCEIDGFNTAKVPCQNTIGKEYSSCKSKGLEMSNLSGRVISSQLHALGIIALSIVLCENWGNKDPYNRPKSNHESRETVIGQAPGQVNSFTSVSAGGGSAEEEDDDVKGWVIRGLGRGFRDNPQEIAELANAKAMGLKEGDPTGAYPVAFKHFPTHGRARDSHQLVRAEDDRELAEIKDHCERTYGVLSDHADIVMTNHVIYKNSPDSEIPAGLSSWWLGYGRHLFPRSVVISDCMAMGAIDALDMSLEESICCTSSPVDYIKETGIDCVINFYDERIKSTVSNDPPKGEKGDDQREREFPKTDIILVCNKTIEEYKLLLSKFNHIADINVQERVSWLRVWSKESSKIIREAKKFDYSNIKDGQIATKLADVGLSTGSLLTREKGAASLEGGGEKVDLSLEDSSLQCRP